MPFDDPEIRALFPVPLVTIRLCGFEALNERLMVEIESRRKSEPGIHRSNRNGWHSALDFFDRKEPTHQELARELAAMVAATSMKLIPDMPDHLESRHEGWVNLSPSNAMNIPHEHSGSFWSGTYYIRVPEVGAADDKLSGAIEFIDPRGSIGSNAQLETPFTRSKFTVRPAAGTCMIWPGFLRHWVYPNLSADDRVSISFNSWFAPRSK